MPKYFVLLEVAQSIQQPPLDKGSYGLRSDVQFSSSVVYFNWKISATNFGSLIRLLLVFLRASGIILHKGEKRATPEKRNLVGSTTAFKSGTAHFAALCPRVGPLSHLGDSNMYVVGFSGFKMF